MTDDPASTLDRFVQAQAPVWPAVQAELAAGRKTSHWMWFVFPQLRGLGRSETARFYGLSGLDEAWRYVAHPVLGPRLAVCVRQMLAHEGRSAFEMLGSPDDFKLRSCLTLFEAATGDPLFAEALARLFGGERDPLTLQALRLSGADARR